jgi:hypothetical protein
VPKADLVPAGGRPLAPALRERAEAEIGPLGDVRVHTGVDAARAAARLGANAYASGLSIVFGDGAYAPETGSGYSLLLHELVHTQRDPLGAMVHRDCTTCHADTFAAPPVNRALLDGIDSRKWDPDEEQRYRLEGQIGLADAMRRCRIEGDGSCNFVLTEEEALRWYYASQEEPSWGTCPGGPEGDTESSSAGVQAMGAPALAAVAARASSTATQVTARAAPHLTLLQGGAGLAGGTGTAAAGTEAAVATGLGVEVAAVAAPVAMFIGGVVVLADATAFDSFKRRIAEYGIYVLGDSLARCIGRCHQGDPLTTWRRTDPFRPTFPVPPMDLHPDLSEPWRDWLQPQPWLEDWYEPQPQPEPDPAEERRRRGDIPEVDFYHGSDEATAMMLATPYVPILAVGGGEFGQGFYTLRDEAAAEQVAADYTRARGETMWGVVDFRVPGDVLLEYGIAEALVGEGVLVFPDRTTRVPVRYPDEMGGIEIEMSWAEFRDENRNQRRLTGIDVSWPYDLIIGPLSGRVAGFSRDLEQFVFNNAGVIMLNDPRVERELTATGSV